MIFGNGRSAVPVTTWTVVAVIAAFLIPAIARASIITFDMSIEFSGATPPEGAPPWLTATLDDGGTAGSVNLRLETTNLTDAEFVFEWLFNLDPTLDPNSLVFSAPTKTGLFTNPTINTAVDTFMSDGDGDFDVQVMFDNSDAVASRFGVGDTVEYDITGIGTLTAFSFDFLSAIGGGLGIFRTVAHVGGIGPFDQQSGWVAHQVPEPSSLMLVAFGAALVARRRRRSAR